MRVQSQESDRPASLGYRGISAHAPPNTMTRLDSPTSTRDNSTTMALIDEVLTNLKLRGEGE
jgi:hypothetical protein